MRPRLNKRNHAMDGRNSKNQQIQHGFLKGEIAMYREPSRDQYLPGAHKTLSSFLNELETPTLRTLTDLLIKPLLPQQRNSQLELWVIVGQEQQTYRQRQ